MRNSVRLSYLIHSGCATAAVVTTKAVDSYRSKSKSKVRLYYSAL